MSTALAVATARRRALVAVAWASSASGTSGSVATVVKLRITATLQRCLASSAGWRAPAVLCALAAFLVRHALQSMRAFIRVQLPENACVLCGRQVWQLSPQKLRSDYQRALLLDRSELFRGGNSGPRRSARPGAINAPAWLRGSSAKQGAGAPPAAAAELARVEDELRLAMSARWFHGAGKRVADSLAAAGLVAAIGSAQV